MAKRDLLIGGAAGLVFGAIPNEAGAQQPVYSQAFATAPRQWVVEDCGAGCIGVSDEVNNTPITQTHIEDFKAVWEAAVAEWTAEYGGDYNMDEGGGDIVITFPTNPAEFGEGCESVTSFVGGDFEGTLKCDPQLLLVLSNPMAKELLVHEAGHFFGNNHPTEEPCTIMNPDPETRHGSQCEFNGFFTGHDDYASFFYNYGSW